MKNLNILILSSLLIIIGFSSCKDDDIPPPINPTVETIDLTFKFKALFKGNALVFDNDYITNANDTIRFDKIKYIFSNFELIDNDNKVVPIANQYAYISFSDNRKEVTFKNIPKGNYKTIRINVGLDSVVNFGNPAQYALDHPLSPSLTDMHWGWAGGYIFNVVEGYYKNNGQNAGFTFHIATLKYKRTHTFVTDLNLTKNSSIYFNINADKYFSNAINYSLKTDGAMSHSGNSDPIMDKYIQNVNGTIEFDKYE